MDIYSKKYSKEFRENLANKKLVIFGTGSLALKMIKLYEIKPEEICLFIESSKTKEEFLGVQVINLEEYLNERIENSIVLIATSDQDVRELVKAKLKEGFYDPYLEHSWLLNIENYKMYQEYKKFQKNYLRDVKRVETTGESVLIMVSERKGALLPLYSIFLGIVLKTSGFQVNFLFNDLSTYGILGRNKDFVNHQNEIIQNILDGVKRNYGISYDKLSSQEPVELNAEETEKLNKQFYYQTIWHKKSIILGPEECENIITERQWRENAKKIKNYLKQGKFEKVYAWTGMHEDYSSLGILSNMMGKSTYYSEAVRGGYNFSKKYPTVLQKDINEIDYSSLQVGQKKKLLNYAEKHLKKIDRSVNESERVVLIPINIFWDSAAFGENDIFTDFLSWLVETVDYLLSLNAMIYIRQHPHELKHDTWRSLKEYFEQNYQKSNLHFISSEESVDTYELVKKARLILPNTTTVGLEAAMLRKQVIVKNDVYYADLVYRAQNKEDYFKAIKHVLLDGKNAMKFKEEELKIRFALTYNNSFKDDMRHVYGYHSKWTDGDIETVFKEKTIGWIIDLFRTDKLIINSIMNM